ncbi:hypothetical protein LSH36_979g02083 [Paralvinella palmiformis]|uniref:C-type lectin domain-containing protein n=1 Tax=Paralvinella palmiformis TaxID=53620 RepID=A0AAD9IWK2_9ANNE|nr:hypothetical protein LSH36_979g02083 [Paralvinella palmiformis]
MCFLVRSKSGNSNLCHRQQFYEFVNNTLNIESLIPSSNLPSYICQRMCRQYIECLAFSLQRNERGFGMCNIYGTDIHQSDLIINDEFTVYMPCPLNFDWDVYVKKCYSVQVLGPNIWSKAVYYCNNTHPRAKLVEPRNAMENERIGLLAGGMDVWLGLYRPSSSIDLNEIRYSSDDQLATYTRWEGTQPNNVNGEENVVLANADSNYEWFDRNGDQEVRFLCEI